MKSTCQHHSQSNTSLYVFTKVLALRDVRTVRHCHVLEVAKLLLTYNSICFRTKTTF